jgi:hypothetical protein
MAISVQQVEQLKELITGVRGRAAHHAQGVTDVIFTLVGLIVWKAEEVLAREYGNHLANETRFKTASGQLYTLSYSHDGDEVIIKKGGMNGLPLATFNNATPIPTLVLFFEQLT